VSWPRAISPWAKIIRLASRQIGPVEKVDQILGQEIKNGRGETIGKINNLAVDLESGRSSMRLLMWRAGIVSPYRRAILIRCGPDEPGRECDQDESHQRSAVSRQPTRQRGVCSTGLHILDSRCGGRGLPETRTLPPKRLVTCMAPVN